jgi:large subunit ribosomal protein L28
MARRCEICGKGIQVGYKVSHSNKKTKKRWQPHLLKIKTVIEGTRKTINVCTRCEKAGKVVKLVG